MGARAAPDRAESSRGSRHPRVDARRCGPAGAAAIYVRNRMTAPARQPAAIIAAMPPDDAQRDGPAVAAVETRPPGRPGAIHGQRAEHDPEHDRARGEQRDLRASRTVIANSSVADRADERDREDHEPGRDPAGRGGRAARLRPGAARRGHGPSLLEGAVVDRHVVREPRPRSSGRPRRAPPRRTRRRGRPVRPRPSRTSRSSGRPGP